MAVKLASTLTALRDQIDSLRFVLDTEGAEEARLARSELLDQLDDYVLPRVYRSVSPLLVVLGGCTGAGKSTLVNTLAGARVSATGVLRPTTSSPILVSHPEDAEAFDERHVLPGLGRVKGPAPDAVVGDQLVTMTSEKLPRGVALLDSPDFDSVFDDHYEFAIKLLSAADVWICVTTAARYADAQVWRLLTRAAEQGVSMGIVLSRVPQGAGEDVVGDFAEMLEENGFGDVERFIIPETTVSEGRLPSSVITEVREWVAGIVGEEERRIDIADATLRGVLDSFRTRVPELAQEAEAQVAQITVLRDDVEGGYASALAELDEATRNGSLLRGEVLARWQDFAGTGDLARALRFRRGGSSHRGSRRHRTPARVRALKIALRNGLESLVVAAADRAAEQVVESWTGQPGGQELLAGQAAVLGSASPELARRAGRAVSAWQDHVVELVRTEGATKRLVAKLVSFDDEALALVLTVGLLGYGTGEVAVEGGTSAMPRHLLKALFGAESLRGIAAQARADLRSRIGMLFDEEAIRFGQTLDAAGVPDETTAVQLYQVTYDLEVAR